MSADTKTYPSQSIPQAVVHQVDLAEYERMRQSLLADIAPQGGLQMVLFEQLFHAAWDQRRFRQLQFALVYNAEMKNVDPLFDPRLVERAKMVERSLLLAEQRFRRALKELRGVQTEKAVREVESAPREDAARPAVGLADSAKIARARRALARSQRSSPTSPTAPPPHTNAPSDQPPTHYIDARKAAMVS